MQSRVVALVLLVAQVASIEYDWQNAGNPNVFAKHCLCRFLVTQVTVHDVIVKNQYITKCPAACTAAAAGVEAFYEANGDTDILPLSELCAVYKMEHRFKGTPAWALEVMDPAAPASCAYRLGETNLGRWTAAVADAAPQPERKIINFFWWGNPTKKAHTDAAFLGITKLAGLEAKGFTINYFYDETAGAINDKEMPGVTKHPIGPGSAIKSFGELLATTDLADQAATVNNILATYLHYGPRTFASLKDLAMHMILYRFGGYFFDASVSIPEDQDEAVAAALEAFPRGNFPQYPLVGTTKGTIQMPGGENKFYHMEFNGAWAPQGHAAVKTMVTTFLAALHDLDLDTGVASTDEDVHRAWGGDGPNDVHTFKGMAGNLVQNAVTAGLSQLSHDAPLNPKYLVFDSQLDVDAKTIFFAPLGITKHYGNLYLQADLEGMLENLERDVGEMRN